jgi:hypothetical protein
MLADGLRSIRDEQAYMMARERTHQASGSSFTSYLIQSVEFDADAFTHSRGINKRQSSLVVSL